ncbi:hypothetical protein BDW67DRAFT_188340 [Aspergillus spinulosporus]
MADNTTDHASQLEKGLGGSHPTFVHLDRTQPGLFLCTGPLRIRRHWGSCLLRPCANAWEGIFLISTLGLHARGVETPNVLLGVLIFFGGLGQFLAAVRSSWVLFIDLGILSLGFLLLAVAYMTGDQAVMTAGYSVTMVTAALSYRAGCAGLWAGGTTPINLPMFPMYKEAQ